MLHASNRWLRSALREVTAADFCGDSPLDLRIAAQSCPGVSEKAGQFKPLTIFPQLKTSH